jgi:hypothetical protein
LAVLVLVALTFAPIVRTIASKKAAARGLEIVIGHLRPGWFSVHLDDTKLTLVNAPAVRAEFSHIEVHVLPWLALDGISVEGGQVTLDGPPALIQQQLEAWRSARPRAPGGGKAGAGLSIDARAIDVSWLAIEADAKPQTIDNISFERHADGARAAFESAQLESRWGALSVSGGSAEFRATEAGLTLESAKLDQVLGRVGLPESEADVTPDSAAAEPIPRAASDTSDDEGDEEDLEAIGGKTPAKTAPNQRTLAERLAPIAAESWPKRREQIAALRAQLAERLGEHAKVQVSKVQLEITHGRSVLNVGPAPFTLQRNGNALSAEFLPPAEKGGKQLTMNASLPLVEGAIEVNLEGGPISLSTLGVREGDFGLIGVAQNELTMQTHVELSPAGALNVAASGRLSQLALEQPALAPEPLRDVDVNWSGQLELDLGQRRFALENGVLGLEDVHLSVSGSIEAAEDDVRVELAVDMPKTSCQDLLTAAPTALLPQLVGLRLGGTLALHSRVAFDTSDPKKTEAEWELDNRCKVLATPEEIDPARFRQPFQHYVVDPDGRATEFATGPTTEQWVPLNEITPYMETGVIVCEDSRFFKHNGFDNKAIRDSILSNVRAGHFVRGASTVSMQLAKNLYLGREKTMSRKLQEAAFTMLLEERLSKEDILELYLNVVEFGPSIYGIRSAAQYYFNSHPGELSLAQAMYLASILPNPKAKHFAPDGTLKPRWAKHLGYLMRVARKINRIGDDELEAGSNEKLMFGQAHPNTNSDFLFGAPLYDVNGG